MKPSVLIVNIAFGDPDLLNAKTLRVLKDSRQLILRTSRSPLVSWLDQEKVNYTSLDHLYESIEDFDQLSSSMATYIWDLAGHTPVVYAVPDLMTDCSVRALYQARPEGGQITVVPGMGISDVFQASIRPLLSGSDLRTVSATDFLAGDYDPNLSLLITELDNPILAGDVKIRLSFFLSDETEIFYLHGFAGSPLPVPLYELDRRPDVDHLSAVLIPGSGYQGRENFVFADLLRIMDRLRAPDGCPWDRVQTHQSLRPYMVEEAWECIAAIEQEDADHLADELGDLLFQIVFHASIGKSFDEFTITDVVNSICRKMIHRHPHVFGDCASSPSSAPSSADWEKLKRSETGRKSVLESLDDVSPAFPSLKYTSKMLKKLSLIPACKRDTAEILSEIREINARICDRNAYDEEGMSRILFLYAELCFSLGLDGELLLHNAVTNLRNRIQAAGKQIINDGKSIESLTFRELGVYLDHVEGEIE